MGHHHCDDHHGHHHCSCCCSSHNHDHCHDDSEESCDHEIFLELADEAWMEVLKDKIKAHIIANNKKLDELAAIISTANHERWTKKHADDHGIEVFNEKLDDFFKKS